MERILRVVLLAALVAPGAPLLAQDGSAAVPTSAASSNTDAKGHGLSGLLIGAAAGIAVGFGIAAASDYPLKEGGGFAVLLLGGGLGGFAGHKVGSSAGRPWEDPGRLKVSLGYAWTTSAASRDIQTAFEGSGFAATDEQHPTAPSFSVTYGVVGPFNTGVELSGIPGQWFRARDSGMHLSYLVGGQSCGVIVNYAPVPSERRRLTFALGAGLDYYSVTVESYFDPIDEAGYPADQPFRASRTRDTAFGLQLRGSLEYALVHDVSLQVSLIGRWVPPIEVPGIALVHPVPDHSRTLAAHSVDLSSIHVSVGLGMRF